MSKDEGKRKGLNKNVLLKARFSMTNAAFFDTDDDPDFSSYFIVLSGKNVQC